MKRFLSLLSRLFSRKPDTFYNAFEQKPSAEGEDFNRTNNV